MPSLLEILKDPNYTEANPATKEAIFNKWAAKDENYVNANEATKEAIRERFGVGGALEEVKKPEEKKEEPESGFIAGARSGIERLQADYYAAKAALGMEGAEEEAKKHRERADAIYKQAEFLEHPVDYLTGLLGQSVPYMVAPVVAGGAATLAAPEIAIAGLLGAGATSAAQFTGSNLSRQLETGKAAKDLDVGYAALAAVPQAALDTLSLKMVPGLGRIFEKAGIELAEKEVEQIAKQSIIKSAGKTATVEGLTESAQQVLERAQAGLNIADAEARNEYFESFIGGALLGGTIGVPGAAYEKMKAQDTIRGKEYEAELAKKKAEAQESSKKAQEEEAKITQTAVPDAQGNVPLPSFSPAPTALQSGAAAGAKAAAEADAFAGLEAKQAAQPAAPAGLTNDVIERAYAENGVSTEKTRKVLEAQLVEAGLTTPEEQKAFLKEKQAELGIPTVDPKADKKTKAEQRKQKDIWQTNYLSGIKDTINGEQSTDVNLARDQSGAVGAPSKLGEPAGGITTPVTGGVDTTGGAAQPATITTAAQRTTLEGAPSVTQTTEAVKAEEKGQEEKSTPAVEKAALTPKQIKQGYQLLLEEHGDALPAWKDLTPEMKKDFMVEIEGALQTKGMLPSKGAAPTESPRIAALKKVKAIVDSYNENRPSRLRQWADLNYDERELYLSQIRNNTVEEQDKAYAALQGYLKSNEKITPVEQTEEEKAPVPEGASIYELNRQAYSSELPRWGELDDDARGLFLKSIERGFTRNEKGEVTDRKVTTEQMDEGFADVWIHNAEKEASAPKEEKGKAQRVAKEEEAAAKEEVEVGKELPSLVKIMLGEGGINNVLSYIAKKAGGIMIGKKDSPRSEAIKNYEKRYGALSRAIFKNIAAALNTINFSKSTVVVDPNNKVIQQLEREGKLAAYDPKTDTFYFTKNGMDEMTVLHEIVHAGTIKILYAFKTNPNSLTPNQRAAAEQINKVYEFAKKRLEGKYPNQLENVYEFVSYALTEPRFQEELARIQAPSLAKYTLPPKESTSGFNMQSLWSHLTKAMMKLYDLTKAAARFFEIKPDLYDEAAKAFGGEKYTKQQLTIDKTVQREVNNYIAAEEDTAGKRDIDTSSRLTFESVSGLRDAVSSRLEETYPDVFSDTSDQGVADFVEKYLNDKAFAEQVDKTAVDVYKQAKIGITKQAGYQGNALLEVTQAFQGILAAPEAGIDIEALPAKAPAKPAKPTIPAPAEGSTEFEKMRDAIPSPTFSAKSIFKNFSLNKMAEKAVRIFQNDRAAIKNWQRRMWLTGRYISYATGFNNIYDQITLSSGNAHWLYTQYIQRHNEEVRKGVVAYAKERNLDVDTALKELGLFAIAKHEEERREILYLTTVPLTETQTLVDAKGNPISPRVARDAILGYLNEHELDLSGAKYLRAQLEAIVNDKKNLDPSVDPKLLDRSSNKYSVSGFEPDQITAAKKYYEEHKAAADKVLDKLKAVTDATLELNEMANYMSAYAKNYIMFYGFANYVPFKGKNFDSHPNADRIDMFNTNGRKLGGELQENVNPLEGRLTVPDNPVLQVMADGAQAAMRAGRKDVTQAIYNAVKEKTLQGSIMKFDGKDYIEFKDRANENILKDLKGETKIFHYMPDGKVAIIQIDDKAQREAIRRTYREINPAVDFMLNKANKITGFFGQLHTRYKVAFAPVNFVRDVLTNAWTIGAEGKGYLGPLQSFRYLSNVALDVATGNLFRSWRFAALYSKGDVAKIENLAKNNDYYKDLMEFAKGGRVSYIKGIAPKGQLQELMRAPDGKLLNKQDIDRFFDIWIDTFELTARVSAFRITKENEVAKLNKVGGLTEKQIEEAANTTAKAYAKNLANFEQVGEWGRALGGLFMFFRPSATGAVRAMDAVAPAFYGSKERAMRTLPEFAAVANIKEKLSKNPSAAEEKKLKAELATAEKALEEFDKNYSQLVTSSRIVVGALAGAGIVAYTMAQMSSDDDELGRNRVSNDDMARWTKFARFHIPGFENPIQLPWGYGLGAFAAVGSQIASMLDPKNPTRTVDSLGNMATIMLDSFMPLPFSRIPISEKPGQMAFDSITPSVLRPMFEYYMNVDALGHQIYNNRQTKYGDAYTGGDNIPESFKYAAKLLADSTNGAINWSPNTMYFFFNNYADGASSLANSPINMALWLSGKKDFNAHTDTMIFDSFFGTRSNVDARQWSKVEEDLKDRSEKIKMFKNDPVMYAKYLSSHPFDAMLTRMYDGDVNGRLKELRADANKWRTMPGLDMKTRAMLVKNAVMQENLIKYSLVQKYKAFGIKL